MITKIILDNIKFDQEETKEVIIPSKIINTVNSTLEDWIKFPRIIQILKNVKEFFEGQFLRPLEFKYDKERESTLEIWMDWKGDTYKYSEVFYESKRVMESLIKNNSWIFCRYEETPDFVLDKSFLNEKGLRDYTKFSDWLSMSLLYCFSPGEELIREMKGIIIVDEWFNIITHKNFLDKFKSEFPDLNYNKIISEVVINGLGFSEYERLDEDNTNLCSSIIKGVKMRIETAGSGFIRLSRIVPLMIASKKYELTLASSDPLDISLHPSLGKALMEWYLEDNLIRPIIRLQNCTSVGA